MGNIKNILKAKFNKLFSAVGIQSKVKDITRISSNGQESRTPSGKLHYSVMDEDGVSYMVWTKPSMSRYIVNMSDPADFQLGKFEEICNFYGGLEDTMNFFGIRKNEIEQSYSVNLSPYDKTIEDLDKEVKEYLNRNSYHTSYVQDLADNENRAVTTVVAKTVFDRLRMWEGYEDDVSRNILGNPKYYCGWKDSDDTEKFYIEKQQIENSHERE